MDFSRLQGSALREGLVRLVDEKTDTLLFSQKI